jgi:hypothetical protein
VPLGGGSERWDDLVKLHIARSDQVLCLVRRQGLEPRTRGTRGQSSPTRGRTICDFACPLEAAGWRHRHNWTVVAGQIGGQQVHCGQQGCLARPGRCAEWSQPANGSGSAAASPLPGSSPPYEPLAGAPGGARHGAERHANSPTKADHARLKARLCPIGDSPASNPPQYCHRTRLRPEFPTRPLQTRNRRPTTAPAGSGIHRTGPGLLHWALTRDLDRKIFSRAAPSGR